MRRSLPVTCLFAMLGSLAAMAGAAAQEPPAPISHPPIERLCEAPSASSAWLGATANALFAPDRNTLPIQSVNSQRLKVRLIPDATTQVFRVGQALDPARQTLRVLYFDRPRDLSALSTMSAAEIQQALSVVELKLLSRRQVKDEALGNETLTEFELEIPPERLRDWQVLGARARVLALVACPRRAPDAAPAGTAAAPPEAPARPEPVIALTFINVSNRLGAMLYALAAAIFILFAAARLSPGSARARARAEEAASQAVNLQATPPGERTSRSAVEAMRNLSEDLRRRSWLDPVVVTQDSDGVGSLSRLQILFFSVVVATTLIYIAGRAGFLSEISEEILLLMGVAGSGTVLAKLVTESQRTNAAAAPDPGAAAGGDSEGFTQEWLQRHGLYDPLRVGRWRDLMNTDGEFDVYKFQMFVFSAIVGGSILLTGLTELAAFSVPRNLMILLGISQAVYVGGKVVQSRRASRAVLDRAVHDAHVAEVALTNAVAAALRQQEGEPEEAFARRVFGADDFKRADDSAWKAAEAQLLPRSGEDHAGYARRILGDARFTAEQTNRQAQGQAEPAILAALASEAQNEIKALFARRDPAALEAARPGDGSAIAREIRRTLREAAEAAALRLLHAQDEASARRLAPAAYAEFVSKAQAAKVEADKHYDDSRRAKVPYRPATQPGA